MKVGFHIPFSGNATKLKERIHVSRGNAYQVFARSLRGIDKRGDLVALQKLNAQKIKDLHRFLNDKQISPAIVHAPYSYNFAEEANDAFIKTITDDLRFCAQLGASYYVIHPGYYKKREPSLALDNIRRNLELVLNEEVGWDGEILVKNMAGAGTEMASGLDEWGEIMTVHPRVKGALDWARLYLSGVDFTSEGDTEKIFELIEEKIEWKNIPLIYLNDTARGCGARKNQFVPLGEGTIAHAGFGVILRRSELEGKVWLVENQPKPSYYDETIQFLTAFRHV